ncbi:Ribosomal protein L1/ribosomal biogenesis protein [Arabidopsis thaliana x Arabidopsis arenosa]|uniref:Ribosomal protein L1/ribosomal biogenesis protein n=1 Tax=Arabidopsis thaliana x Arabidopsis arenosa TaxID=1240361 RepID=A0A8T1ZRU2_9BRAS|nr:Ribosomal protein L1/ribosomal biogenesis protein [Arabidopsis thaliana x Arabidopsis arenosa]
MTTAVSPPPQEQTEQQLVPASQTSRVSPYTVGSALNGLTNWRSDKSKTEKPQLLEEDELVYLIASLKKIPQTSRTNAYRIPLPHPLINPTEDSPELCLIIDDRPKSGLTKADVTKKIKSENIPITKVIKLSKLKSDYKAFEAKRKLCDSYDMFFADRRIIPLLPRVIGKKFFASKKIPVAIDLKHKNWKQQIEKACGSAMFFIRTGTCSVIKVGKLSMELDEITENVMATLNGVVELLPNKWKYVRSLHLKLSESLALPIYQSVPDLKLKIDAFATGKSVVKEEKEGEVEEVAAVHDGEKSVTGKGKKKKGRIHEVRYMDSNVAEVLDEDEIGGDEDNNQIVESEDKEEKKRKKEVSEVAETEKPMKKAAKGKLKPDVEKPMKKAVKGKTKPDVVKSKDGLKANKTTKIAKDESGGGLKPQRKKSGLRK